MKKLFVILICFTFIIGCGGGGGSNATAPTTNQALINNTDAKPFVWDQSKWE